MTNWRAKISYEGSLYKGFQIQPTEHTVGGCLQNVVTKIFENPIKIVSAGRTDSGVHAEEQVVSFLGDTRLDSDSLLKAIQAQLPSGIRILSLEQVPVSFDARKSAYFRAYSYLMSDAEIPLWLTGRVVKICNINLNLNQDILNELALMLIGNKDFACFRNTGSFQGSSKREIFESTFIRREINDLYGKNAPFYYLEYRIKGSGFLYKMVRNIIGAMLMVLRGKQNPEDFRAMIEKQERIYQYAPAPAHGLCFREAGYEGE